MENRNSHTILVGMQIGLTTLKINLSGENLGDARHLDVSLFPSFLCFRGAVSHLSCRTLSKAVRSS